MTTRITDEQLDALEASLEAAPEDVDECLLLENLRNDTPLLIDEARSFRRMASYLLRDDVQGALRVLVESTQPNRREP